MYRLTTTISIICLGLISQFAHADAPQDVRLINVHFADLDLTRSEAAAELYQRLAGAAKTVCTSLEGRDLASQMRFKGCVETAVGSAIAKVDRPLLTTYYKTRTNGRHTAVQIAKNQN
jgi:UrcA family protein